jgi:hypothetical protein
LEEKKKVWPKKHMSIVVNDTEYSWIYFLFLGAVVVTICASAIVRSLFLPNNDDDDKRQRLLQLSRSKSKQQQVLHPEMCQNGYDQRKIEEYIHQQRFERVMTMFKGFNNNNNNNKEKE